MKTKILLHLAACYIIADFTFLLLPDLGITDDYWAPIIPQLIAVAVSCLFGLGKEFWDKYHDHEKMSAGDLAVDITGAFIWLFAPLIAEIMPWMPKEI